MKYIANILSKSKKYKFNEFINVTTSLDEIDKSVPTLVVGTDLAKKLFGDELNYITKKIDDNITWTYSTIERRSVNENDINEFHREILKSLKNTINYKFFSVLNCRGLTNVKKLIDEIDSSDDKSFLFTDKMLYIAYDNNVIGISLDECGYIGIKKRKLALKIKNKYKNVTSLSHLLGKIDGNFFENDDILLSAMFCYLNK